MNFRFLMLLIAGCAGLARAQMNVSEVSHHGQNAWKIETPAATYVFQKAAGGFSSLLDPDGNDWISFKPGGGPAGEYRGIPNLVHPEGFFHPGSANCTSRIETNATGCVAIHSECDNGQWACRWDISPVSATLTVLTVPKNYWFLYEGTPGGQLDEDSDWVMRSDGAESMAFAAWKIESNAPRWVVFGDGKTGRALLLTCDGSEAVVDTYWPMQHRMTVFGFGRNKLEGQLNKTPARFMVAFIEPQNAEPKKILQTINSMLTPTFLKK